MLSGPILPPPRVALRCEQTPLEETPRLCRGDLPEVRPSSLSRETNRSLAPHPYPEGAALSSQNNYDLYDRLVELDASEDIELLPYLFRRERTAVGTVGEHGVNCVADLYDSCVQRYLLACQARWIAAAIDRFVMMADAVNNRRLKRRQRGQNLDAPRYVRLNDSALLLRQHTGFSEDLLVHDLDLNRFRFLGQGGGLIMPPCG